VTAGVGALVGTGVALVVAIGVGGFVVATGGFVVATGGFVVATGSLVVATGGFVVATGAGGFVVAGTSAACAGVLCWAGLLLPGLGEGLVLTGSCSRLRPCSCHRTIIALDTHILLISADPGTPQSTPALAHNSSLLMWHFPSVKGGNDGRRRMSADRIQVVLGPQQEVQRWRVGMG
jgi:hypothetical protein